MKMSVPKKMCNHKNKSRRYIPKGGLGGQIFLRLFRGKGYIHTKHAWLENITAERVSNVELHIYVGNYVDLLFTRTDPSNPDANLRNIILD